MGAGEYSHWEGMDSYGNLDRAIEWGMRIGDTDLLMKHSVHKKGLYVSLDVHIFACPTNGFSGLF